MNVLRARLEQTHNGQRPLLGPYPDIRYFAVQNKEIAPVLTHGFRVCRSSSGPFPFGFGSDRKSSIVTNLRNAANTIKDPVIIINADSDSPHQSVINVMEAARIAGLTKITFSTKVKMITLCRKR